MEDIIESEPEIEFDEVAESGSLERIERDELPSLIEALLFASGSPLSVKKLAAISKFDFAEVEIALQELRDRYAAGQSGIQLVDVSEGVQLRTHTEFSPFIQALRASRPRRLTPAALETLAVIAYRQPVVKSDIETIRGVDATPTLKTLIDRSLVRIVGYQATVGQPALYGTTDKFLEVFGLKSLNELPSLRDLRDLAEEPGEEEENVEDPAENQAETVQEREA